MRGLRILSTYRWVYCLLILVASVQSLIGEHGASHVALLASAEIAGAVLLLWRRTQVIGLILLLAVFAFAQLLAALESEWPTRFVQYAASALMIVCLDRALLGIESARAD